MGLNVPQVSLLLLNFYALRVSLRAFVFFFFNKNSALQYISLALKILSHIHIRRLPVLSVSKAWIVLQTLRESSVNVFWQSFLRITGVELARKVKLFLLPWKNSLRENGTVAKSFVNRDELFIAKILTTTSVNHWKFNSARKGRKFPTFLVGKNGIFFYKSTFFQ